MTTTTRQFAVAIAFAATVALSLTGAALRGETREAPTVAETCQKADWPLIPAECLGGDVERSVRIVTGNEAPALKLAAADMTERFAIAFRVRHRL